MASHAKIEVFGNLGQDPETRYTPSGAMVVSFSLAVNPRPRPGQEDRPAVWYRVSAFGQLADRLDKLAQQGYIAKGRSLIVRGDFDPRPWTNNDGEVKISYDINAYDFSFVGGDRTDQQGTAQNGNQQPRPAAKPQATAANSGYVPGPDSFDDVPF